jgi:hypothetical protein
VLGDVVGFVAGELIGAIFDLPFDLIALWTERAAKKNAEEFEREDAISINPWKHLK